MKRLRWSELHRLTRLLVVLAVADFLLFAVVTVAIGGDAASGAVRDGHYFVSNHGVLTEVARATWLVSRVQGLTLWVLGPGAVVAMAVDSYRRREEPEEKSFLGRGGAPPRRKR
jgi:hypothetical protein